MRIAPSADVKADPTSLAEWKTLPGDTGVTCQATISTIVTGARFDTARHFIGWLAVVSLEKAKRVK